MSKKDFIAQFDDLLKPLGFARQKTTWNRRGGSVVEVIDIQVSKIGDAITVNTGVLDPDVHRKFWGSEPSDFIEQPICTVCARIGELIDGRDKWWPVSEKGFAVEAAQKVATYVLPFLDQMRAREAMKRWLTKTEVIKRRSPPPIINLAILTSLLGESAEACALLAQLQPKSGSFSTRISEIRGRLGCT